MLRAEISRLSERSLRCYPERDQTPRKTDDDSTG
jgi:hypothetical protein